MLKGLQRIWDRVSRKKEAEEDPRSSGDQLMEVGPTLPMTPDVIKFTLGLQIASLTREEIAALDSFCSTISLDFPLSPEEEIEDLLNRKDLSDIQLEHSGLESLKAKAQEAGIDFSDERVNSILITLAHRVMVLEAAIRRSEVDVMNTWNLADLRKMEEEGRGQ
ncbi:MAG: hypothetical protein OEY44_03265 [Candidatus Peregrinibacteria bacterium]|nr:hypothetical protein [Candidatus Peregrinibacteria bacterium]